MCLCLEKKGKCWRPKCFLYPPSREQCKLPRPVLPGCPRPASPCSALALCSLGPLPQPMSLELSSLALLSRNTTFCTVDLPWASKCSLKGACSHHPAFGAADVSFPVVLRFMTCPLDGDADLPVASIQLTECRGLVPPSSLS